MKCNICNDEIDILFHTSILGKYDVAFYKCCNCGFIQTEEPYWLNEAYSDECRDLDVGMVQRNLYMSTVVEGILKENFACDQKFLDFGGGYGLFVRLMRDKGFDFYRYDLYCDNIFAKSFDIQNFVEKHFELVTAFELLEHISNPIETVRSILSCSDSLICSTELQPDKIEKPQDWWYFALETGQHVAFYTINTLNYIASQVNSYLYTNKSNLFMFTKKKFQNNSFESTNNKIIRKHKKVNNYNLESLIQKDYEMIKAKLRKNKI
jgi:2-polyprenyl-3-methyl-5-hydroxy-6-metoxy-1,4-benzoquinol methylase